MELHEGPSGEQPRAALPAGAVAPGARLRVLQVITHFDMGGAEGVALDLIDALRPQIDFSLFAVLRHAEPSAVGADMMARLERWQVPYGFGVGGAFKRGGVVVAALRLVREIKRFRADVVHLHTEIPELTYATACMLSRRARGVPLLRTVHNSTLWIDWAQIGSVVTTRLAHGQAIAVSRSAADADAAIVTRRPRARAQIVYNGARATRAYGADRTGPFRMLFAGRLVHQKGADLLPAILAEAHRRTTRRDVDVTIAGTGVLREALARDLAHGLDGWTIRIVPPIDRLPERLGDYDGVLLPSRFEGFGLLAVEALLAGVPLVTTDGPGLEETVPADYPLKAKVDDVATLGAHVARMIDDPERYRDVAASFGRDLAIRFDPAVMGAAYAEQYRALAATRARA